MHEEKEKLKKEPLSKNEPVLDVLENFHPIQIECYGDLFMIVALITFAEEIMCVTYAYNHPTQKKPGIEMDYVLQNL